MPDGSLSPQDIQDLQEIASKLPAGHPMQGKISLLLNSQPTQFENDRTPGQGSGAWNAIKSSFPSATPSTSDVVGNSIFPGYSAVKGLASTALNAPKNFKLGQESAQYVPGANNLIGKTDLGLASAVSPLVGMNPESSSDRATHADTGGVLGEAVVPTATALAGYGLSRLSAAREASTVPRAIRAQQELLAPSSTKAGQQVADLEMIKKANPYLSQQAQEAPVLTKQPSDAAFPGQRMGVMNLKQNVDAAATKLWNDSITPRQQSYSDAPINGDAIASSIKSTVNPSSMVDATKAGKINDVADFYGQTENVGDALDKIKALNEDKQIQAYEKALPDKKAEMLGANPELEAKIKAADALRDEVFNSIEKHGTPQEADYIRGARQDYGALKEYSGKLENVQVPTPESLGKRLGNTLRLAVSPRGVHSYGTSLDTLFRVGDPNALASKASGLLGDAALTPRQAPPLRSTPWAPPAPGYSQPIGPYNPDVSGAPRGPVGNPPPLGFGAQYDPMWDRTIEQNPQPGFETPNYDPTQIITPSLPSYSKGFQNIPEYMRNQLPASLRALPKRKA